MRKFKTLLLVIAALLLSTFLVYSDGCAAVQDQTALPDYKTFELTLNGEKVVVNLPDKLPLMDKAVKAFEECFNAKVCRQQFCVSEKPVHDHVDFLFINTDVVALVWTKTQATTREERFTAWIYIENEPVSATIDAINELIRKHDPK